MELSAYKSVCYESFHCTTIFSRRLLSSERGEDAKPNKCSQWFRTVIDLLFMCQSTHASFVRHRRVDIDANVGFNVEQFAHPFVRIFYVNIAVQIIF